MKKLLVIVLFYATSLMLHAQGVKFGILVEPRLNWLSPDVKNINKDGSRMGINIGVFMDNYFTKNYAFAMGVSVNNTGGKLLFPEGFEITTTDSAQTIAPNSSVIYKIQYIAIPLGLKFKTNDIGYFNITSNVGLTSQVKLKAKANSTENDIVDENISEEINLFDLGYHIGGGIDYSIGGSSAISVSVIYTNGFLDITKRSEDKINLSSVALKIGLIF